MTDHSRIEELERALKMQAQVCISLIEEVQRLRIEAKARADDGKHIFQRCKICNKHRKIDLK